MLKKISFTEAEASFDKMLDDVSETHEPVLIEKENCSVVLMSIKKYETMLKVTHLANKTIHTIKENNS